MAINHAFMSLAIFSMLIIVPIYWTMCHPKAMERAGDNQFEKLYQCVAHTMPPIACIYNSLATDFIFYRGYARVCFGIAILPQHELGKGKAHRSIRVLVPYME